MRILSQDIPMINAFDIPYEMAMLSMSKYTEGRYRIYAQGTFIGNTSDDNFVFMAEYSTEAKARKAMEMLRNAYSPKIEIKEPIQKEMPKPRSGDWFWSMSEPKVEVLDNFYFQFPSDDEVEV